MDKEINQIQIKNIIRRRKKSFISIFLLLFLAGLVVALALPPIYKSEALIRIEEKEIQENLVNPSTNDYVEKRIGKINQQVLSRTNLEGIIKKFNLYSEGHKPLDVSELVGKFREDILMETIVSEMQSKPGGKFLSFTVAFNLSYQGKDPVIVQKVTDTLANLYIEEDVKSTERVLNATTNFLKAELERLKNEIEIQEKKVSEYKKKHIRELPTDISYNIHVITRLEQDIDRANVQLRNLHEKRIFLVSQLAQIEPLSPIVLEGEKFAINPNQRLKELNIQLIKLQSVYSDKHPDIKRLKNEIEELETQLQSSDDSVKKVKRLRQLENKLASLEGELGPNHPDVRALKEEIALVSKEVSNLMNETIKLKISEEKPDNPAYINIVTQINAINTEIQAIEEEKKNLIQSIENYQKRIEKGPVVEKELNALTRDYEAAKQKYKEVWNELTTAQVAQKVEGIQRGRRFSLASPAYLPTKPDKPNRLAIILVGLLVAITISSLFAAFQESIDISIKTEEQLKQITNTPVLASVSYMITSREKKIMHIKTIGLAFLVIILIGAGLYFTNQYIINLEHLWSIIFERIKMIA
jgi:uncharacterized protein involved in exopolysaccharide biosynthesis